MRFSFLFLLSLMMMMACSQGESSVEAYERKKAAKKKKTQKEEPLSIFNVKERLLEYGKENPETLVLISTNYGDIKVKLYEDTPLHRANFIRLIKRGYYDHTQFFRVESNHVMQGGSSDERNPVKLGRYRIPEEMMPKKYLHKKGALAAARFYEGNPERASDSHEFYLVKGQVHTLTDLKNVYKELNLPLTPEVIKTYTTIGGTPHIDGQHTVFGEVIEGLAVIDKVTALETDKRHWPKKEVTIKMKILDGKEVK